MSETTASLALTRAHKSVLLYIESCLVDYGGLLDSDRMNKADHDSIAELEAAGFVVVKRVPAKLLGKFIGRKVTHYAELTETGWALAHEQRKERAQRSKETSTNYELLASHIAS